MSATPRTDALLSTITERTEPDVFGAQLIEHARLMEREADDNHAAFKGHTEAVAEFLRELYAIMVDPCAEGVVTVKEMQKALLDAAKRDRDSAALSPLAAPESIPVSDILREIEHIKDNANRLKRFDTDEARCRELCASYLQDFIHSKRMGDRLAAMDLAARSHTEPQHAMPPGSKGGVDRLIEGLDKVAAELAATSPSSSVAPDLFRDRIEKLLREYRCHHTQEEEGNGMQLVDVFTPIDHTDITAGKEEVHLLADMLASELSTQLSATGDKK